MEPYYVILKHVDTRNILVRVEAESAEDAGRRGLRGEGQTINIETVERNTTVFQTPWPVRLSMGR